MKKKGKNSSITIKNLKDVQRIANRLKETNYRAYILWSISIATGYRGVDVIELTIADLKKAIKERELVVLEEKTKNTRKIPFERVAPLGQKLIDILKEFVKDKSDAEYVYPSKTSKKGKKELKYHIGRIQLGREYKRVIQTELGIVDKDKAVGTHTPRKTYGYFQYIDHNKDIYYVMELFGHSNPRVTKAYIGLDEDDLLDSVNTSERMTY